jgi:Na+/proline symporter
MLVVYFGILAAFIAIYLLFKRESRETVVSNKYTTIVDYFADRFGVRNAAILNLSLIMVLFIFICLQFIINTSIFSNIFNWGKYTSASVVGSVVLLYTLIGGLKVSILTDVFQGILMLVIGGMVFLVDTSRITLATVQPMLIDSKIIIGSLSLGAAQFLTLLTYPELWQRVYAARSLNDLKKGLVFAWLLLLMVVIPELIIGLCAKATGGVLDPGDIFYVVLKLASPTWYIPILSVALLAAFMSTLDAALFALGAQLGKYGFWFKSTQEKEDDVIVRRTRYAVTGGLILALTLSLCFSNFLSGAFQLISLLTVLSLATLAALVLRLSEKETTAVLIAGIVFFIGMAWGGLITKQPLTTLYPSFALVGYTVFQTVLLRARKFAKYIFANHRAS